MVKKTAFSLIELIFAIVIIGITVFSLPIMNNTSAKGIENSIVQEAIFAASTELTQAVTNHWDANSTEPSDRNSTARVIDMGSCNDNRLMPGHINETLHRRCLDSNTTKPADHNSSTVETVENAAHDYKPIFINPTPDGDGYKDNYQSKVVVDDNATFGAEENESIKKITVTIENSSGNIVTSLRTYVTNIGEVDYYYKEY